MAGLFRSLNIGSQSLYASRQGIDTTAHNISNAHTEGFSRQRAQLRQRDPVDNNGILIGEGAYIGTIERAHDKFIEKQINVSQSNSGDSDTRFDSLTRLGEIFSPELSNNLSDDISEFFNSWHELSRYPEELAVRTQVQERGFKLAEGFRRVDRELRSQRQGLNDFVDKTTKEINKIIGTIAHINQQIRESETGVRNPANDLRDNRDLLVSKLSNLVDINYYEDKDGMFSIRGPGEILLVDRSRSAKFEVVQNGAKEGMYDVIIADFEGSQRRDVTDFISGGRLNALIEVRDKVAGNLIQQNNHLAENLIRHVNEIHKDGFGLEKYRETNGRNFFEEIDDKNHVAQNIQVSLDIATSPDAISASNIANTPGDNITANRITKLQFTKIFSDTDATFNEYYADVVGALGMETVRMQQVKEADDVIVADLKSRRESVSGVSLDEEAANLIRWQTAFTASSKVITTVDELLETVLSLKR